MKHHRIPAVAATALVAALAATASTAAAQRPKPKPKITEDSARVLALAEVPNGKIRSGELEHEKGRWIYSFDIKVAGKAGIEEINVDAMTGKLVAHEHESPAAERKEARAEAKSPAVTRKP
ncbi:MAG TPA: PepSY domain-containing protein [Acidothermaceae bacterium]